MACHTCMSKPLHSTMWLEFNSVASMALPQLLSLGTRLEILIQTDNIAYLSSQIPSDFSPDAGHEVKLRFALGQSYRHMGRYTEAREVLEKALIVCNEEGIRETREGAGIAKELGWIYM